MGLTDFEGWLSDAPGVLHRYISEISFMHLRIRREDAHKFFDEIRKARAERRQVNLMDKLMSIVEVSEFHTIIDISDQDREAIRDRARWKQCANTNTYAVHGIHWEHEGKTRGMSADAALSELERRFKEVQVVFACNDEYERRVLTSAGKREMVAKMRDIDVLLDTCLSFCCANRPRVAHDAAAREFCGTPHHDGFNAADYRVPMKYKQRALRKNIVAIRHCARSDCFDMKCWIRMWGFSPMRLDYAIANRNIPAPG